MSDDPTIYYGLFMEQSLKERLFQAAKREDQRASQVLRQMIRDYCQRAEAASPVGKTADRVQRRRVAEVD